MVFDECWGITSTLDGGGVMACGTGIEECELFENNDELYNKCSNDPRTTWRSLLIRVDNNGKKIWVKQYGTSRSDIGYSLTIDTTMNIYITGTYGAGSWGHFLLMKLFLQYPSLRLGQVLNLKSISPSFYSLLYL